MTKFKNVKRGWYLINDTYIYFRSRSEYVCAVDLQDQVDRGLIDRWEFEPKRFVFEPIIRGTREYIPDFRVWRLDGTYYWVEVKGYMTPKSKTQLKRMAKYYPDESILLLRMADIKEITRRLSVMLVEPLPNKPSPSVLPDINQSHAEVDEGYQQTTYK